MKRRKLSHLIEACRTGSSDLEEPEMARLAEQIAADPALRARYERTQKLDAQVGRSIANVEVPDGLHVRLLANCSAGVPACKNSLDAPSRRGRLHYNRRLIAIAAIAASLLLLVGGYVFWPRHRSFTYDDLLKLSTDWYTQLRREVAWQFLPPHEMVRDYPVAGAIRPHPAHWADVSSLVGESACAYDLTTIDGRRAALLVIFNPDPIAGTTPPLKPGSSTGGLMVGCWQSGNLVYVLIVEGTERSYRGLLDGAAPPLAKLGGRATVPPPPCHIVVSARRQPLRPSVPCFSGGGRKKFSLQDS